MSAGLLFRDYDSSEQKRAPGRPRRPLPVAFTENTNNSPFALASMKVVSGADLLDLAGPMCPDEIRHSEFGQIQPWYFAPIPPLTLLSDHFTAAVASCRSIQRAGGGGCPFASLGWPLAASEADRQDPN